MVNLRFCPNCNGTAPLGRIRVNYAEIMRAFTDAGILGPDIQQLTSEIESMAVRFAPKRTGRMAKSHYRNVLPPTGYTRLSYVGNRAGYAPFVLGGTAGNGTGYIFVKPPRKYMKLRPAPYSYFNKSDPRRLQMFVRGQKGDNWLREALRFVVGARLRGGNSAARRIGR